MAGRMAKVLQQLPWLLCELGGAIVGYAYAGKHHERAAYQWSVDTSVYLHGTGTGRGLGRTLYTELLGLLVQQGYYTAYAGITLPNAPSVGLHEKLRFRARGGLPERGLQVRWLARCSWWQKPLRPYAAPISGTDHRDLSPIKKSGTFRYRLFSIE